MKKSLVMMFALASGVAYAEYKDGNGGAQIVSAGTSISVDSPTYSEYHVSGKGGVFYVENGAELNLTGAIDFYENYQDETIKDGSYAGTGIYSDVYLEDGAKLNISAQISGDCDMQVDTESGVYWQIIGGELNGVTLTADSFSGSVADSSVSIGILDNSATPALTLTNVTLEDSSVLVDPSVSVFASCLTLNGSYFNSLGGNILLGGNNAITLTDLACFQLAGVTLADGAALALTLPSEQLGEISGDSVTVDFFDLTLEGDATFTVAGEGMDSLQVVGYTIAADGGAVIVTLSSVVPEPTTATLSLLALAALAARRRRR